MAELTLSGLRVLEHVAALGSFTAAAEVLGYTQSAISRQVAGMETAVGTPLFERSPRGVRLSEAGAALVEHAASVQAAMDMATNAVARVRDRLAGQLSVGGYPSALAVLVPRAIARLAAGNPALTVTLHEASTPSLLDLVRAGGLDLAVVALGAELPEYDVEGLRADLLMIDALRIAVPAEHRLAGRHRVAPEELRHEAWIVGRRASPRDPRFGTWPSLASPRIAYAVQEWPARLGLVAAGLGIAIVPGIAAVSVPAGVTILEVDDPSRQPSRAVVVSPTRRSPAADAMAAALRHEAARIATPW